MEEACVQFILGCVHKDSFIAAMTLIQLMCHLFAEEAQATGWGGEGEAQRSHLCWVLHGFTICATTSSSSSQFTHVSPSNKCSKQTLLPPPLSQKPKKKNKKDTQKLPLAALRTPRPGGEESGRKENRAGKALRRELISFIPTQVRLPDVSHVNRREEGVEKKKKTRLKLENLIYLIISQNNQS